MAKPTDADPGECFGIECVEGEFVETVGVKHTANVSGQVRWAAVPGPDHGGSCSAQCRCRLDGSLDVSGADVAEDPAQQKDVRRQHILEGRHLAGVSLAHVDLR